MKVTIIYLIAIAIMSNIMIRTYTAPVHQLASAFELQRDHMAKFQTASHKQ